MVKVWECLAIDTTWICTLHATNSVERHREHQENAKILVLTHSLSEKQRLVYYTTETSTNSKFTWLFQSVNNRQVNTVSAALTVHRSFQQTAYRTATSNKHPDDTPEVSTKRANATDAEYRKTATLRTLWSNRNLSYVLVNATHTINTDRSTSPTQGDSINNYVRYKELTVRQCWSISISYC